MKERGKDKIYSLKYSINPGGPRRKYYFYNKTEGVEVINATAPRDLKGHSPTGQKELSTLEWWLFQIHIFSRSETQILKT